MKNKEYIKIGTIGTILIYLFLCCINGTINIDNFGYFSIQIFLPMVGLWWCYATNMIILVKYLMKNPKEMDFRLFEVFKGLI